MPAVTLAKNIPMSAFRHFQVTQKCSCQNVDSRDLTILGRQRDDDGQNNLFQINDSKDNSSYIINRMI